MLVLQACSHRLVTLLVSDGLEASSQGIETHPGPLSLLDNRESVKIVLCSSQVPGFGVIVVVEKPNHRIILDVAHSLEDDTVQTQALDEVSTLNLHVEAVQQVLEDDGLDDAALHVVDLPASLNYFLLFPVVVVHHHARCHARPVARPRHDRDSVRTCQSCHVRHCISFGGPRLVRSDRLRILSATFMIYLLLAWSFLAARFDFKFDFYLPLLFS